MLKISQRKSMNHCRFRALDTKGQSDNAVCYSSLTKYVCKLVMEQYKGDLEHHEEET